MSVVKVFNRTLSAFRRYEGDLNHFTDVVERTARANARPMGAYYAFFGAQLLFLLPAACCSSPRQTAIWISCPSFCCSFWWAAD